MAEFKFSCPQCSQHIQCDTGYAGAQINCPTCNQSIVVPQPPRSAAAPPPPPLSIPARHTAPAPVAASRQQVGLPAKQPAKSKTLRTVLVITAAVILVAALGVGSWFGFSKYKAVQAKKGNPAAQVATPTATSTVQALSVLSKVHSAYTNMTNVRMDDSVTVFLDLSNITVADVSPNQPAVKNSTRHPQGMPRVVENKTELSVRRSQTNLYYIAGDAVSKIDRQTLTNTFAIWSSGKGQFMFTDSHMKGVPASYMQLADSGVTNQNTDQMKQIQEVFADPANLAKIIKDLGQTDDETVNGQSCYTLTAKVLGQKVKIWVDKTSYLVSQWEITLGGAVSDTDIDDVFELYGAIATNTPAAAMDMIKAQVKQMSMVMLKIRGTITSTSKNIELNPTFTADDFNYDVPPGVRLVSLSGAAATTTRTASLEVQQRNACINNLRQIDAAKNEFALEKGKANGTVVTEDDIKPYIKLDADGNLPKCPSGGTYTIGKVGEKPTCSTAGHFLP